MVHDRGSNEDRGNSNGLVAVVTHDLIVKGSEFEDVNVQTNEDILFFFRVTLEELLSLKVFNHQIGESSESWEAQFEV